MKKLIRLSLFMALSLAVHLLVCDLVDATRIERPYYAPMEVTLVRKKPPQQEIAPEIPPEKPKPKPVPKPIEKPEPPKEIIEEPPEPEEAPEPQPAEEQVAYVPEAIDHELVVQSYHQMVVDIIRKNLYYPGSARRRGIEGTVYLRFVLDASGTVSDISVEKTSGYALLDKASVKTIKRCVFPPPPDDTLTLSIPITFKLIEDS
ncbi:MAG TPA: energy transducer TonB [Deltaproteobacteria bacterium]|nr:energy transducer TonB [Deltaproteobacteria bacterium]